MEGNYLSGSVEYCTHGHNVSAPIFKKRFVFEKGNAPTTLEICAVGFYRLFIDGKEITKGYLSPYISNPDEIVYYDAYALDGIMSEGEHNIYVMLGNGFSNSLTSGQWEFDKAPFRAAPKFRMEIKRGEKTLLCTDESFTVCDSPITFDDYRNGEFYDSRLEGEGENIYYTGINERKPLVVLPPKGVEKECGAQSIRDFERIKPVNITKTEDGYVYDFGVNFTGVCRLNIDGERGQQVEMLFFEVMNADRPFISNIAFTDRTYPGIIQRDRFTCKGGRQVWQPSFTYHGFRRVLVSGITEQQATDGLLEFVVLHSDIQKRGGFVCSDDVANRVQECTERSDLSNFFYFPTDCPHREKNGWTGDVLLSAEQLLYNFDCERSLAEWLNCVRAAQRDDGALPGIVPTCGWGYDGWSGPAWDGVIIEAPYMLYKFGGDKKNIVDNAAAIKKYISYLNAKINDNGLLSFGLGDWAEVGQITTHTQTTPNEVTDTLVTIDLMRKAVELFGAIGDEVGAASALELEKKLCRNFAATHIAHNAVDCMSQTAQSMALTLGLFEDADKAYAVLRKLLSDNGDRIKIGVIGAKWLFDCLCDHDDADLAYALIADERFPSYGYAIAHGATTLWETFYEFDESVFPEKLVRKDGSPKIYPFNHHFWGSVSAWFYKRVAGLTVKSASEIEIAPCFISSLDFAEARYARGGKSIVVRWARKGGAIELTVDNDGFDAYYRGKKLGMGRNTVAI